MADKRYCGEAFWYIDLYTAHDAAGVNRLVKSNMIPASASSVKGFHTHHQYTPPKWLVLVLHLQNDWLVHDMCYCVYLSYMCAPFGTGKDT